MAYAIESVAFRLEVIAQATFLDIICIGDILS